MEAARVKSSMWSVRRVSTMVAVGLSCGLAVFASSCSSPRVPSRAQTSSPQAGVIDAFCESLVVNVTTMAQVKAKLGSPKFVYTPSQGLESQDPVKHPYHFSEGTLILDYKNGTLVRYRAYKGVKLTDALGKDITAMLATERAKRK